MGRLARALNVMLERIQAAFSARLASEARLKENEHHLRQFVADASHELRTPIAAVSAYAELFERGAAERADDLPRVVSGIRAETARMDRLVNDLLTLARLDEGVPMEMAPVELVSLASDAVRTASAVGPDWPVRFWAAHPVEVSGDKDRLRQVLDNLLANVRAHTPPGTTTTVRVDQIGDHAEIEVRDTGPGMPDEEAHRVFERFYRADRARSRTSGGSGLGLAIVAAIVAAHGGTVSATSALGSGLVVSVRIPMSTVQPDHEISGGRDPRISGLSRAIRDFTPDPQPTFTEPGGGPDTMRDMTALAPYEADVDPRRISVDVEIVVPVYNEAAQLAERITALRTFLDESFPFRTLVTVVDNASTDDTVPRGRRVGGTVAGRGCDAPAAQGTRLRAARGLVDQCRSRRRLHGRRPLHLAAGAAPPRGAAALWSPRRRHRVAARPAEPTSCAAPSESSSPGPTTCC